MTEERQEKPRLHSPPSRREVLALLAAAGLGLMERSAGAVGSAPGADVPANTVDRNAIACTPSPEQTEGPFFIDEKLKRADIRFDTSSGSARPGVPLALTFRVFGSRTGHCAPLAGAMVDVWHCDADGNYSDVGGQRGRNYLRGYQVTDANGEVRFQTIFPGCYVSRATHIHFKIRRPQIGTEFTSQIYFDTAILQAVYLRPFYSESALAQTNNERDGIFRNGNGSRLIVPLMKAADGYAGTHKVVVQI